jgi:MFS transporter, DHA1 family, tetracycline resistance protein
MWFVQKPPPWKRNLSLATILFIGFIDYLGIGLVYPLFSSLLFDPTSAILPADSSATMRGFYLGLLLSLMPITQFFSAPILGSLSDRKGRKKILLFSLLIGLVGYALSVLGIQSQSLGILLLSRIVIGASGGSSAVVQAALADRSSTKEKAKNFGLYNMALGAGFTLGPFLGGKLSHIQLFSIGKYALPFWFALSCIFINIVLAYLYFEETHDEEEGAEIKITEGIKNIQKAVKMEGIRLVLLCAFFFSFGWSFFFEFVPVFLIGQFNFKSPEIGNFYGYSGALYALSCGFFIRPIISRFSHHSIFLSSLLLSGIYVLLFLWIENAFYLWFYIPILLFLIALVYPTVTAMISNWAGKKKQGEILGVFQSIQSVAFAISPLFSGSLLGSYISMPILMGGSSILLAGLIFGFFCLIRKTNV